MTSLNNVSLDFKVFDCPSKEETINQFKMLMKDPEVQPCFRNYIENIIATSELRISKRLDRIEAAIEKVLSDPENPMFLNAVERILATSDLKILKRLFKHDILLGLEEPFDAEEERAPNLPEQIKELSDRIEQPLNKPTESIKTELRVIKTTLEHKASGLVEHLKTNVKPRNGEVFLNSREIMTFLKHEIKEEYRLKNIQNPRQAKKDIIEKAKKMFSDFISLDKKKHGNRDVRIVYKPKNDNMIPNRMGTYIRS